MFRCNLAKGEELRRYLNGCMDEISLREIYPEIPDFDLIGNALCYYFNCCKQVENPERI